MFCGALIVAIKIFVMMSKIILPFCVIVRSSNFDALPNLSVLKFLCSLYSEEMFSLGAADSLNEGRGCCMIF